MNLVKAVWSLSPGVTPSASVFEELGLARGVDLVFVAAVAGQMCASERW